MLIYLFKFSACLTIFIVFYKLFLERENMHHIKRYYLMSSIIVALTFPLITFTTYIEPVVSAVTEFQTFEDIYIQPEISAEPINYLPIILWSLYGLGVLIFGIKFIINLSRLISKINQNPKQKSKSFINVLVEDLVIPHTFFSYIFLNKQKFEAQQIPKEVFIHEEAHARQKHSLDVLLIELLQIVFWFNPLIYLMKTSIKMNHEFLADEAVLKQGIATSTYQQILLTFSSNVAPLPKEIGMANAINYSSIKKRFTVMNTHTSKKKIWLRSFVLLPLVALTLYGFSERKIVEKEIPVKISFSDSIDLYLNEKGELLLGEEIITLEQIEEMYEKNNDLYISIKVFPNVDSEIVKKTVKDLREIGIKKMTYCTSGNTTEPEIDEVREEMMQSLFKVQNQLIATQEEVKEYNKLAKHSNAELEMKPPIIKARDVSRIADIYVKMSIDQKKNAEPYPDFSKMPPPPSPATGFIKVNGETLFVVYYVPKRYYNEKGYLVDKNGMTLNGNNQVNASDVLPGQYITKVYQNDQVVVEFKDNMRKQQKATPAEVEWYNKLIKEVNSNPENRRIFKQKDVNRLEDIYKRMSQEQKANAEPFPNFPPPPPVPDAPKLMKGKDVPPPPPIPAKATPAEKKKMQATIDNYDNDVPPPPAPPAPKSPLDHVMEMAKKGATFYYEGNLISSDEAIQLLKKNKELNISTLKIDTDEPKVYISKEIEVPYYSRITPFKDKPKTVETTITTMVISTNNLDELKKYNWKKLKDNLSEYDPDTMVSIEFNFNKPVLFDGSKIDSFSHKISCRISELDDYISKSQRIISKLKEIK